MELTSALALKSGPRVRAHTLTWLWEPESGSGERIAALLSIVPHAASSGTLSPGAYVLLPRERLSALLGKGRADSAHGILRAAAEFMTHRLMAGAVPEEVAPPFKGFHQGPTRQALGFNIDQLIDVAVRSASAFGQPDEIAEELVSEPSISTETTRAFLERVKVVMAPPDDEKRKRFNKRVRMFGESDMVIDYAHNRNLVQFASAPLTDRQRNNMAREAKAKLFEAQNVGRVLLNGEARFALVINTSALLTATGSAARLASKAVGDFHELAKMVDATPYEASSHEEAAHLLASLA